MDDVYGRYRDALRLGHQLAAEGRFKEALRHYQAAAELAGSRALPHVAVGGMLLRLGQARDALAAFDRALEREPDDPDALSGRVAALLAAGRRAEAAQVQALMARPREPGASGAPAGDATPVSGADNLMATGEQARALQDPQVLRDGRQRHGKGGGELRHRRFPLREPGEDGTPCGVRQGREGGIEGAR